MQITKITAHHTYFGVPEEIYKTLSDAEKQAVEDKHNEGREKAFRARYSADQDP
jgi:hypothetical protein